MSSTQAVTKIQLFEDGTVKAEIVSAGTQNCATVAEIFNAFGPDRKQTTKEDGDCKDVFENVQS